MFGVHSPHPKVRAGPPVAVRWTINFTFDGAETSHSVKIICDLYMFTGHSTLHEAQHLKTECF